MSGNESESKINPFVISHENRYIPFSFFRMSLHFFTVALMQYCSKGIFIRRKKFV